MTLSIIPGTRPEIMDRVFFEQLRLPEMIMKCARSMPGRKNGWKNPFGDGKAAERIAADALVKRGIYNTKNELIEDALRTFFEFRKDMRIADELAGVSTEEIKDFLAKAGVRIRRGFSKDKGEEFARLIR